MAAVPTSELPKEEQDELLCTYAALLLHDEGAEINTDNMNKLINAAGGSVEPYWPALFCKLIEKVSVGDLLKSAGTPGGGAGAAAPAAGGATAAAGAAPAVVEAAPEVEEEEEADMGFSLFD